MRASGHTCLKSQVLNSKEAAMRTVGSRFGGLWIVAALLCSATAIDAQRDWGHAEDYVESMWKILNHKKPDDFVIATNNQITVKKFINLVCKKLK